MPPITVFYVINGLGTGGAERSLAEALPALADGGVRPIVVALSRRAEGVQQQVLDAGFDVHFLDTKKDARGTRAMITKVVPGDVVGNLIRWRDSLRNLMEQTDPDIIHTTHFDSDVAGRLAGRTRGTPILTSLVNTADADVRREDPSVSSLKLTMTRRFDAWTGRRYTTHFHAISEAVKRDALSHMRIDPRRVTVVYRGRDSARLGAPTPERRLLARQRMNMGERDEIVINVGRREFQKGQRYLIQAMSVLALSRPNLHAFICGREGRVSAELIAQVEELGLQERVHFLGHRDDVPELLAAADIFAFPSLYEGLGGSVIEAMALGLPIVATDIDAIREVVEPNRNARLVPIQDAEALASGIADLLDDPEMRTAYGARSRRLFEERFTLERSVEGMLQLYENVHAGRAEAQTHA